MYAVVVDMYNQYRIGKVLVLDRYGINLEIEQFGTAIGLLLPLSKVLFVSDDALSCHNWLLDYDAGVAKAMDTSTVLNRAET